MQEGHLVGTEKLESDHILDLLVPFMACMPPCGDSAGDRCLDRGLLPAHLLSCLQTLHFLSFTVISAQKAQRQYGVRASVLLSMALDEFGFDVRDLANDPMLMRDTNGERMVSPNIDKWFVNRAKQLTRTKQQREALDYASVEAYIGRICELGFGDSFKASDLWANVKNYNLDDCDRAGMLPIGGYRRFAYEEIRDELGNLRALKPNLNHQEFLIARACAEFSAA